MGRDVIKTFPDGYSVREDSNYGHWVLLNPDGHQVGFRHLSLLLPRRRAPWLGLGAWLALSSWAKRALSLALWIAAYVCALVGLLVNDGMWPLLPMAVACGGVIVSSFKFQRERKKIGSNRRAQEDHPDPQAKRTSRDITVTFNTGGIPQTLQANAFTGLSGLSIADVGAEDPRLTLETVQEDMPILAHRYAKLTIVHGKVTFRSVTGFGSGAFGVDAEAECSHHRRNYYSYESWRGKQHSAPDLDCSCGFYAVPADLLPKHSSYGGVSLLVELSGKVIEHEEGYRAEHQRVVQVMAPLCAGCAQPAVKAWRHDGSEGDPLTWDCGNHEMMPIQSSTPIMAITLDQMASILGVPVVQGTVETPK